MVTLATTGGHPDRLLLRKMRRDVFRQKWQFIAVAVTIVLGTALFAASTDAFSNLSVSYERTYERLAFADLTISGGDQGAIAAAASSTDGVAAVSQRVQADVPIQIASHKLAGRIVSLPVSSQPDVGKVDVVEGEYLPSDDPNAVLVEKHMADHFGLHPGDTLTVALANGSQTVNVVGVAISPEYLWPARSRQDILTTPDDFGVLFGAPELVSEAPNASQVAQVLVLYAPGSSTTALDRTMNDVALGNGATDVLTRADQPSNAALSEDLQGFSQVAVLFPLLFLIAAAMATFVLMNRIVLSQRSVVGTLRASGFGRWPILRHFLGYGVVIGVASSVVGVAIGAPLGAFITGAYTSSLSIPDTVLGFHPLTPIVGIAFGLVAGAIAAAVPARMAMHVSPAEAMRGTVPSGASRLPLLERIFPPLRRLPLRWRMPLRSASRSPWRSFSTFLGVVLALVLVLASWGMIDTVQLLTSRQFDDIQHNDAQVYLNKDADMAAVEEIAGIPGVSSVEPVIGLPVAIRAGDASYATQLQAFTAGTQMHSFLLASGGSTSLPSDGILVGVALRNLLPINEGDSVTVSFPSLGLETATTVAGFVDEPLGTYAYASRETLDALVNAAGGDTAALIHPATASLLVTYDSGANGDSVRARLSADPIVTGIVSSNALQKLVGQYLALFYGFVGIMLVFGATMAFALMFNAISVSLAERSVEFATMRANGMTAREVGGLLTRENVLVTLVGLPIGVALGYEVASLMMSSYSSDLFSFDLRMRWSTPVLAAAATLIVTLLSEIPARHTMRRLEIARVVRERSQ